MEKLTIYTDGASRGNPGKSASGYEIYKEGKLIAKDVFYNGIKTNNYAEYMAVIKALEWCASHNDPKNIEIELFSDSTLIIGQLGKGYKVRSGNLKDLYYEASKLASKFFNIKFNNVPRETPGISRVDKELNKFLDAADENGNSSKQKL
ncbi:MAG: ribonuclease HI family protein [Candidatus Micrarchaeia archaeon]